LSRCLSWEPRIHQSTWIMLPVPLKSALLKDTISLASTQSNANQNTVQLVLKLDISAQQSTICAKKFIIWSFFGMNFFRYSNWMACKEPFITWRIREKMIEERGGKISQLPLFCSNGAHQMNCASLIKNRMCHLVDKS